MARPKPNPELIREQILTKAQQIIQKKGFDALTMKALATELNMSVGKIYTVYAGKDAIFLELEIQFFKEVMASIESGLAQNLSATEQLRVSLQSYYLYASSHFDLYTLVTRPPKVFSHYIGSEFEPLAKQELDIALTSLSLLKEILIHALPSHLKDNTEAALQRYLFLINSMHGLIMNSNSSIFPYITNDDISLIDNRYQQPDKQQIVEQQLSLIIKAVLQ
ncbi:TetR/AcrR family transcriptional regulator [Alkalimarinus coralli]|uniref:TetR/AcrR family transcriptional regulator n=1 Tax=Alkalimarinus coralli TaxID=2935863 RepID=UPI00202AC886|nr:TetR/AcrR family transcriptional regulator [Alkalimarinus coralli]